MYHAWKHSLGDGNFLVYDLGGGTFDVSIIRCLMGEYQVLGIHGDNYLGGDDLDRRLAERLRQHLVQQGYSLDLNLRDNPDDATRFLILTRIAREAKEALSSAEHQYIGRQDIFLDHQGQPVTLELELSRAQWDDLMASYVAQTLDACREALQRAHDTAGVGLAEIDQILLVGGSTRSPLIQRAVADAFCGPGKSRAARPLLDEPDTCVALGAAIHAANLGGLGLGDHSAGLGVHITSPLTTRRAAARLLGRVCGERADEISEIALRDLSDPTAPTTWAEAPVEQGAFKLTGIELPDDGAWPVELALRAQHQDLLALPMELYRGADARPTGGALSNPTVLAKDISLEVVKLGRPDRHLLLEKGTSLPVEASWRFFTADQSGAVILRLLQGWLPIRTLHLEVPAALPLHTPVELTLSIDDTMAIIARGAIHGQQFWAQIQPPPPRVERDWAEIEALMDRCAEVERTLWGHDASYFKERTASLKSGIREAAQTDPDKLYVLVGRLEELLQDYRAVDRGLTPSFERFDRIINLVRRRVFSDAQGHVMGLSQDAWQERLADLERRGADAWQRLDQPAWGRAYSQIQAIWESLAQEDHRYTDPESPDYLMRAFLSAQMRARELREELLDLVLSDNDETRKVQEAERLDLLSDLDLEVTRPLELLGQHLEPGPQTRAKLEALHGALRRLDKRAERLPALGLVST
jgi:molecular chaperone DnaK